MKRIKLLSLALLLAGSSMLYNSSVYADDECASKDQVCTNSNQCCGAMICVTPSSNGTAGTCQLRADDEAN